MPPGRVLMVQGTASSVGKSLLVAGLCRLLLQEGYRVVPFKAQNMSNNAAVVPGGGEIGRAQALQAMAARVLPRVEMNPVLLKPEGNRRSQVVVLGTAHGTMSAPDYHVAKQDLWPIVAEALDTLRAEFDVVVAEGAGSPAEINLKDRDIANMRVARYASAPVLIVGDIDRGGVFAHLFGTFYLLEPEERALVRGFVINKLRGDPSLLAPGPQQIESLTGVPVVGVVPWLGDLGLPEEDSAVLDRRSDGGGPYAGVDVAIVRLPRIANFDDFDPLEREAHVRVRYVESPARLGTPDLVILPGTKATRDDLAWLQAKGWPAALQRARDDGAFIVGICGGFQMLGAEIEDPLGVEGASGRSHGLRWLDVSTRFQPRKVTRVSAAHVTASAGVLEGCDRLELEGYEIHAGISAVSGEQVAIRLADGEPVGALSPDGRVLGCYLHGLFGNHALRQRLLTNIARSRGKQYSPTPPPDTDAAIDRLAAVLRASIDLQAILRLIEQAGGTSACRGS
jgi:adenosylcobyric acid synthase